MPPPISAAAPHELMPALRLLFGDPLAASAPDFDAGGLLVARDGGTVCGAVLAQTMPGALGAIHPPTADSPDVEDSLVVAALGRLRAGGAKVCQAFAAGSLPAALLRNGFRHVTQLVTFRRRTDPERDLLSPAEWPDGARYHPDLRDRFASTLLATQTDALDCPELDAARTSDEVVAGFALPARFWPWHFLAYDAGRAAGLALVEPGDGVLSVAYLGVVPGVRGRGFGGRLLRRVLHDAAEGRFAAVELSVDARNEPALRLYRRHGFTETERRDVLLADLGQLPIFD